MIVFLQQAYQVGLLNSGILSSLEMKMLIPDVLDTLLDFHLRILRRIRQRILESKVVNTISDIIFEEVFKFLFILLFKVYYFSSKKETIEMQQLMLIQIFV